MKIGAERDKLKWLAVVTVILLITVYVQFFASSAPVAAPITFCTWPRGPRYRVR